MFEECRIEGDFTLTSGNTSEVFYDFDLLTPREAAEYVEQLLRQMEPVFDWDTVDFVATPAVGGIVPAFLTCFAKDKPLVIIDKEGNLRGPEFSTGNFLIVDDVITSFKAVNRIIEALPESKCVGAAAYIFRGSHESLSTQGFISHYLARKEQEQETASA
jgi:orotate phosphoribosyltransferase